MLNQIILVGRLTEEIEIEEKDEKKFATITLSVPRSWKNADGIYENDFIKCIIWNQIAENTKEYCKKGDILGVKGRIQSDGDKMEIIAEKVTFLSNRKESEMANDRKENE
jgi:single-strand DNA-binding protein